MGEFIDRIKAAIQDLQNGKFILIYDNDSRESETDLVIASEFVKPESIKTMRKDGGGLIFLMIPNEIANKLKLPFLADLYLNINNKYPVLKELTPNDIPYDTKSSFSLYINHRKTFTGITDIDRSLTMRKFAELTKKISNIDDGVALKIFGNEFRSPGHVPICIASKNLKNTLIASRSCQLQIMHLICYFIILHCIKNPENVLFAYKSSVGLHFHLIII